MKYLKKSGSVTIVVLGERGAGKSSLLSNIFPELPYPRKAYSTYQAYSVTKNDITLKVVDSIGLAHDESVRKQQLKELAHYTNNKADLVVFCIPVEPGTKFVTDTPQIMESLQRAFGKNIWRHCLVVFTFSNLAWELVKADKDAVKQYKDHIKQYTTLFQQDLDRQIPHPDVTVGSIFQSLDSTYSSPSEEQCKLEESSVLTESHWENRPTIVTIPAGREPTDPVLPGIREQWMDVVFAEMLESSVAESKMDLLKFRYNTEVIKRVIMQSYKYITSLL